MEKFDEIWGYRRRNYHWTVIRIIIAIGGDDGGGVLPPFGRRRDRVVIRSGGFVSISRCAVMVMGHQRRMVMWVMVMVMMIEVGQIGVTVVDGRWLDGRCAGSGVHVPVGKTHNIKIVG